MSVLDKIHDRRSQRQAAALSEWRRTVRAIGDDAEVRPEKVEQLLADSGRTLEDLTAAVELYRGRKADAAAIAAAQAMRDELPELHRKIDAARARLAAAERRVATEIAPAEERIADIQAQLKAADAARERLEVGADPEAVGRHRRIQAERNQVARRRRECQVTIDTHPEVLATLELADPAVPLQGDAAANREAIDKAAREFEQAQAQLPELLKREETLKAAEAAALEELLRP